MPFKFAGLASFCANEKWENIVNDDRVKHSVAKWGILITFSLCT
ncbi:hypothetical protein GNIT_0167 [Glaciecola nitratireducens FR1064]|uniref:Uncharacterized protein n=1 Tax=Glaciecola nitratireducens (strain JCM 12485 / KCTC 12276 / FR1064) TaxID=1085623 RepID=G4QIY1_GLANF|nr:hypothetical protein GNIT_0167 [Glaciecola nitratireducens FR1064]